MYYGITVNYAAECADFFDCWRGRRSRTVSAKWSWRRRNNTRTTVRLMFWIVVYKMVQK